MERVWPSDVYHAEINWRDPISFKDLFELTSEDQEIAYFYKVLGLYGNHYSLYYIGKVFKQDISQRLQNRDHKLKRADWEKRHKRVKFFISLGDLHSDHFDEINTDKYQAKMIDDLESLLIYSHSDHTKFKNKQSIGSHRILFEYHLKNTGFLDEGMLSEIAYGMFYNE